MVCGGIYQSAEMCPGNAVKFAKDMEKKRLVEALGNYNLFLETSGVFSTPDPYVLRSNFSMTETFQSYGGRKLHFGWRTWKIRGNIGSYCVHVCK